MIVKYAGMLTWVIIHYTADIQYVIVTLYPAQIGWVFQNSIDQVPDRLWQNLPETDGQKSNYVWWSGWKGFLIVVHVVILVFVLSEGTLV
jgi:hypothetical protein